MRKILIVARRHPILTALLALALLGAIGNLFGGKEEDQSLSPKLAPPKTVSSIQEMKESNRETEASSEETPFPMLTEIGEDMAIGAIKEYPEVLDAAVVQDELYLSLALIVVPGTSKERARQLGDKFVRLVKALGFTDTPAGEEPPEPGERIGEGLFNYLIGVYYPDETLVVMGAKAPVSDHMTW